MSKMKTILFLSLMSVFAFTVACASENESTPVQENNTVIEESVKEKVIPAEEEEETEEAPILDIDISKVGDNNGDYLDPEKARLVINDGDITIGLGDDFTDSYTEIGDPEIEEGQACLDEGYDTNYYYNKEELIVYTHAKGGRQIINGIFASQKGIKTADGIEISVTKKDDVFEKYGDANQTFGSTWTYLIGDGKSRLSFTFDKKEILTGIDLSYDSD